MKVLGVDWGRVHIGLALSDDEGRWAFPQGEFSLSDAVQHMEKLIDREDVQLIIVGNPIPLSGVPGPKGAQQLQDVRQFSEMLSSRVSVPVQLVDERFTNMKEAKAAFPDAGDHERAAAVLLQDFLARRMR